MLITKTSQTIGMAELSAQMAGCADSFCEQMCLTLDDINTCLSDGSDDALFEACQLAGNFTAHGLKIWA